jgi:hypothetical protein
MVGVQPWVMQIVVRFDRQQPPERTPACEVAGRSVVALLTDPRASPDGVWWPEVERWLSGPIRKHCRRARGAGWERAAVVPGVTVTHPDLPDVAARAFVPSPLDAVPAELARLQLSGTEPSDEHPVPVLDPEPGGAVVVSVTPEPPLPFGKAAAAAGHATQLALAAMPARRARIWIAAGLPVRVEHPDPARWAGRRRPARGEGWVQVTDGGLTVVAPGTVTARARWR